MRPSRKGVFFALLALVANAVAWFAPRGEWITLAVFAVPAMLFAIGVARERPRAAFWSGVGALLWFSHGVMVAYTRRPELAYALVEASLSVVVVISASVPGLRSRFAKRR